MSLEQIQAERAVRKQRRDRQNINVTLYVASLLLVAASALFIGTSLPAVLRFAAVWVVTAAFYSSGFILHAKAPRLRAAAIAFAGTGLALIPVTGLAMYNFALHNGPAAWLVTSVVGTFAYAVAAVRLDSRVLAFLSLSFVVSTAWSGVSLLGGALVWYFASLIGLAVLLTLVALRRPGWLPPVYVRPLMILHPYAVPFVALAATFVPQHLGKGEYAALMAICGIYFAVMAALPSASFRREQFYAARGSFTLAMLAAAVDSGLDVPHVLVVAVVILALQSLWVAFEGKRLGVWFPEPEGRDGLSRWRVDALVCFAVQLVVSFAAVWAIVARHSDMPPGAPLFVALVCGVLLGWRIGGFAEWLPVIALAVAVPFLDEVGGWTTAALLAFAGGSSFLRAWRSEGVTARSFVLAGRIALSLAVPAVAAGALTESPDRSAAVILALIGAATSQLLLEAGLIRAGIRTIAPGVCITAFAAAGMAVLPVLFLIEAVPGRPMTAAGTLVQVLGAATACWVLFPLGSATSSRFAAMIELLAPLAFGWALLLSFSAERLALGNIVLLVAVLYFVIQAPRLPRDVKRRAYWWAARFLLTVLAGTGYLQLLQDGGGVVLAGEKVQLAVVVFAALGLQLVVPLIGALRGADRALATVEAAVVLSFMAGSLAVLSIAQDFFGAIPAGSWQGAALSIVLAISTAGSAFILRTEGLSAVLAPAALAILAVMRGGHVHDLELVLAVFVVFSAVMVAAASGRMAKGAYFIAARALSTVLVAVAVRDSGASATVASLTFAGVLVAQHIVRWLVRRRLHELPFQQAALWVTLTAQAVLPVTYLAQQGSDDGGRWVLQLELALLLVAAVVAQRVFAARGAVYFMVPAAIAMVTLAGPAFVFPAHTWLAEPLLTESQVPLVLLALALLATSCRLLVQPGQANPERWFWLVAAFSSTLAGGLLAVDASHRILGIAWLVLAVVCFAASHLEGMPGFYAIASPAAAIGATIVARSIVPEALDPWRAFLPWLLGCVGSAVVLYGLRWSRIRGIRTEPWRRMPLAITAGGGVALAAAMALWHDETALAGAGLLAAAVVVSVVEVPPGLRLACFEIGSTMVLAAAQWALLFGHGATPELFWVMQWFVVLAAVLAGVRYFAGNSGDGKIRWGIAAGLLSISSVYLIVPNSIFQGSISSDGLLVGAEYTGSALPQLWVLLGFASILLAGLLASERLFVWWGASGVALSVMWALRSYAFAMLALVALTLIVLAVWRLNRTAP
ncbi:MULTISPECIES: hypothetical protein [Arthrobacter]|uniref:Uncharacterized protein n=1 Tax=Arthrobacter terricola TaxID=2547396 RepID=A0A4R5L000_9MICC|nr:MULTISPECIES: hypothetical protein [Arthrobacter]MBT8159048.1 hypothetical protein [Arthrobacter sp. GN70]TDG01714.1 hypothetical protein E1809_01090 [Arthrobacter terricola]